MPTHKWKDLKYRGKLSKEQVDAAEAQARALAAEMTLRELREALGVTQEELARAAQIAQSEVSRLERREDWRVSTLRRIVEALGGELEVVARFPGRTTRLV